MVDKCMNRHENHMDVFALYAHTMPVSILMSSYYQKRLIDDIREPPTRAPEGIAKESVVSPIKRSH